MRRRPKPWGFDLWDKVERFLEDVEEIFEDVEADGTYVDLRERAHELRKLMIAENARRAEAGE